MIYARNEYGHARGAKTRFRGGRKEARKTNGVKTKIASQKYLSRNNIFLHNAA